ncbi:diguanylate cyclase (GGDEF)-like protein/PAS domain S-box-containing protein [Arthrobacter sp. CAN_A6]|uniref:putative bifunctional diguanylate cyclase/phosphodiesterase n=1 Tax=Arthrobacter sp. CAN_A6 TaxID=2787721 RepID=UPI0018CA4D80
MQLRSAPHFADAALPDDLLIQAMAATSEISLITDARQNILHVSDSFIAITGYGRDEALGRNCRMLQGPGTNPETTAAIRGALAAGEDFNGEILNYRKDGSAFWNALRITPLRSGNGVITHFVSVQRDINTRMALLEQLRFQALHDSVTGLPNRIAMGTRLDELFSAGAHPEVTSAVGVIGLDDFRTVNNTHGHATGDALLKEWAARLQGRLRDEDFLGRMGGDEFVLILKDVVRETVHLDLPRILERLHEAVESPFLVNGESVRIGMSLGVALFPEDGLDAASLLKSADTALSDVKIRKRKRNLWWELAGEVPVVEGAVVDSMLHHRLNESLRTSVVPLDEYRLALFDDGLEMHVQPVIDLRDGSVRLVEALARLRLPDGRLTSPDEFLAHLGRTDLDHLFTAMLEKALSQLAVWDVQGLSLDISVNLPPATLLEPGLALLIEQALNRSGIAPQRLGLELLESETLEWECQRHALQELTRLGVGISMDDLGAGYSSLKRLSSLPFKAIKLDRDLLAGIRHKPPETLSLIATLIQMGRDFRMTVVVEGLEDEGVAEAAAILGATLGQGYYFSRPMPAADAAAWVAHFGYPLRTHHFRTHLGALAYHWQFARLGSPHPRTVGDCPLTAFLSRMSPPADVERWHAQQHDARAIHPGAGRLLVDWFVRQIRDDMEAADMLAGRTAP